MQQIRDGPSQNTRKKLSLRKKFSAYAILYTYLLHAAAARLRCVMTRQKIGRLRVTDANNPEAACCRMTKGAEEIVAAIRAGRPLVCVSDGKAFGF